MTPKEHDKSIRELLTFKWISMFDETDSKKNNNMETRNVKLTLKQAKEFYKKGGDLREIALTAYTEEELQHLPTSWEEFCKCNPLENGEAYIGHSSEIEVLSHIKSYQKREADHDQNLIPSERAAKAHLALMKLHQLRDCYRQGWVPDWDDSNQEKYCIIAEGSSVNRVQRCINVNYFLAFQSREVAGKFLERFVQDIYDARELLK